MGRGRILFDHTGTLHTPQRRVTAPSPTMAGTPLDRQWPELPDLRAPPKPFTRDRKQLKAHGSRSLTYTRRQLEFPLTLFASVVSDFLLVRELELFASSSSYLLPAVLGAVPGIGPAWTFQ